jgi:PEGA domain
VSSAAAAARVSEVPPPLGTKLRSSSVPPAHSGVISRPAERPHDGKTDPPPPPLFGPPSLGVSTLRPPPVVRVSAALPVAPAPAAARGARVEGASRRARTEMGLGLGNPAPSAVEASSLLAPVLPRVLPPESADGPASAAPQSPPPSPSRTLLGFSVPVAPPSESDITTARTQPMRPVDVRANQVIVRAAQPRPREEHDSDPPPSSSRPPIPGLLRAAQTAQSGARYSMHDVSEEHVETRSASQRSGRRRDSEPGPRSASSKSDRPVAPGSSALSDFASEDAASRSRRATPKERPGRRKKNKTRASHAPQRPDPRRDDDAASFAPDPREVCGVADAVPAVARAAQAPAGSPVGGQADALPEQAVAVVSQPSAPADADTPQRVAAERAPELDEPKIASDPRPSEPVVQPLPGSRVSYEAFMREVASARVLDPELAPAVADADARVGAARPNFVRVASWVVTGSMAVVALIWVGRKVTERDALEMAMPAELAAAPVQVAREEKRAIAAPVTLIMSEPAGAEVILGGAVLGNTPLEVPRPAGDELFLVRLAGFEPQLVRLTAGSRDAVRVTLAAITKPAAYPPPTAAPAAPAP